MPAVGLATLAVAIVLAAVALAGSLSGVLSQPVLSGAGTVSEGGHPGTYYLYAQTGTTSGAGGVTFSHFYPPPQLSAAVTHVSLDGQPLSIGPYVHGYSSTLTLGNRTFTAVGQVQVPHNGTLTLTADSDEGPLIVAPTIGGVPGKLVLPGIVAGVGLIVVLAGILARVTAGRRGRVTAGRRGRAAPAQPPG